MGWTQQAIVDQSDRAQVTGGDACGWDVIGVTLPDHAVIRAIFGACMAAGPTALAAGWRLEGQTAINVQRIGIQPVVLRLEAGSAQGAGDALAALSPLVIDVLAVLLDCDDAGAAVRSRLVRPADVL